MTASNADTSEPSGPAEFVVRRVGVVGLGHMGHAFAVNLIEDGFGSRSMTETRSGWRR
jgi:hypothetical protein